MEALEAFKSSYLDENSNSAYAFHSALRTP
jgi:hypothetical protein